MSDDLKFAVTLEDHVTPDANKASASLVNLKTNLGGAAGESHKLGEGFIKVKDPAEYMHNALEGVTSGVKSFVAALKTGEIKGMVEGLTDTLAGLAQSLDLVVPGLGQLTAAVVKVGGAITGMTVGVVQSMVEMALEVNATNDKLEATFDALGVGGPAAGKKTMAMLDDLSSKLPQSREQLALWTKQYEAMGMTDLSQIRNELLATASAQAIMGDQGASTYEELKKKIQEAVEAHHGLKLAERTLTQLYSAGVNLDDVAKRMGMSTKALAAQLKAGTLDAGKFGDALQKSLIEKGKGPLDAMGSDLSTLKAKGMEVLGHLFDGIDTRPITDAIKSIISLGDQGQPSGQALKKGIGSGIQGIINWMGKMMVEGEVLFLTLEVWVLKHKKELKTIEKGFGAVGDAILGVIHAVEWLFAHQPPAWLVRLLAAGATGGMSELAIGGIKLGQAAAAAGGAGAPTAPAHAKGGLVMRPAPGEVFASVAPGEMILPVRETKILQAGIGEHTRRQMPRMFSQPPANANGAAAGSRIEHLEINITAPHGVTDAHQLSVTGLTLALERYQLAGGR